MNAHAGKVAGRTRTIRCAIYTRKSSDEGLDQDFNTLDAQYEACAADIASQRHEGWTPVTRRFDDGGLSGGTRDRPALQRLLAEIDAGRIDMVVVYKIDRLTRSRADFVRLVERLEARHCSFVSVTQAFNTSSSMGRLTLNVLLSFARFEREVTAERIRDKIAASKRKGLWMGGSLPPGYDRPEDPNAPRVLRVNPEEAAAVARLFALYADLGHLSLTREAALAHGLSPRKADHRPGRANAGIPRFSNGQFHDLLTNPAYRGQIRHHRVIHAGQHPPIVDAALWDRVQSRLQATAARRRGSAGDRSDPSTEAIASLCGRCFDETGDRLTPSHTNRHNRRFRCYVSRRLILGAADPAGWRLPAPAFEAAVLDALRRHLRARAEEHDLLAQPDARQADGVAAAPASDLWPLVAGIRLAPGHLAITLDPGRLAAAVGVPTAALKVASTRLQRTFQTRRRGIETRIVAGTPAAVADPLLQQTLARAHRWLARIRAGTPEAEIARTEGHAESHIRTRLNLPADWSA